MGEEYKPKRLPHEEEQALFRHVFDLVANRSSCCNGHKWETAEEAARCCNGWVRCKRSGYENLARNTTWANRTGALNRFLSPETLSSADRELYDSCFGTVLVPVSEVEEIKRLWRLLPDWMRREELTETDGLDWLAHYYVTVSDA